MKKIIIFYTLVLFSLPNFAFAAYRDDQINLLHGRVDTVETLLNEKTKNLESSVGQKVDATAFNIIQEKIDLLENFSVNSLKNSMNAMMWFVAITLVAIVLFFSILGVMFAIIGYKKILSLANEKINKKVEVQVLSKIRQREQELHRANIGAEISHNPLEFGMLTEEDENGHLVLAPDETYMKRKLELMNKRKKEQERQQTLSIFNLAEPL